MIFDLFGFRSFFRTVKKGFSVRSEVLTGLLGFLIVCLLIAGCASKEMAPEPVEMSTAPAVSLLLTPAEALTSGDPVAFSVIGFDANGKRTSAIGTIEWMQTGLTGALQDGTFYTR